MRCSTLLTVVTFIAMVLLGCHAAHGGLEDAIAATCRITCPDQGRGSGTVFERQGGNIYILTAAHVVGAQRGVTCEFWQEGHQSLPIAATVGGRNEACDAAWLVIPAASFGGRVPTAIPFAERGKVLPAAAPIMSVGCAEGAWATAWKGHVIGYEQGGRMHFVPPPANGRSGSAILSGDGTRIVGLLQARPPDHSSGIATTSDVLRAGLSIQTSWYGEDFPVQCGPGGCSPDAGGAPSIRDRGFIFPRQQQQQQLSPTPYPTLPLPQPTPAPTDLGPILQRLDMLPAQIAAAMPQVQVQPPPLAVPAPPPQPAGPDPATQQQLQTLNGQQQQNAADIRQVDANVKQLQADLPKQIEASVKPVVASVELHKKALEEQSTLLTEQGKTLGNIDSSTQLLQKLHARLEGDIAAGGLKGRVAEKIEGIAEDPTGWIKHALITMGIVGAVVFLVLLPILIHLHAKRTGKAGPLEKAVDDIKAGLQTAALAKPGLIPLAAGATAADAALHGLQKVIDKIESRVSNHDEQLTAVALATPSAQQPVLLQPNTAAAAK